MPSALMRGDLRLGGHYQFEGNAGEIVACEPPEQFKVTWGMHGQFSCLTITLAEQGSDRTLLRLEHVAHVPDDMWSEYGPGAVGVGWDGGLLGLALYLAWLESFRGLWIRSLESLADEVERGKRERDQNQDQ